MHFPPSAWVRVLASLGSLVMIATATSPVASQEPAAPTVFEDGHEHLHSETAPGFNESGGCGQIAGFRGPYVRQTGVQTNDEPVLGPWGDFFGRDIAEVRSGLVAMQLPGMNTPKDFLVHERVAPALQQVIDRLDQEAANGNTYEIRAEHSFSYNPRTIGGRLSLSFHAIGAAIDINSTTNPYRGDNVLVTDMPAWFVRAWTDAGWCWGGNFQTIKDAMHFSWQGPMSTPGYGPTPPPHAPRTSAADFTDLAANQSLSFAEHTPGYLQFLEDADRDGAPDVIQVETLDSAGRVLVTAARAHQDFETCRLGIVSAAGVAAAGRRIVMGDGDRDSRPDLWSLDETGSTVTVSIFSFESGFQLRVRRVATPIPSNPLSEYMIADHDLDGHADLYVLERTPGGTQLRLDIWDGAVDFATTLVDRNVAITDDTTDPRWHFAVGDHDVDGKPDVYVIEAVNPVQLNVFHGANTYGGSPTTITSGAPPNLALRLDVGDYDGDGRDDLYSIRTDGKVRVYLGGDQPGGADLSYWFRDPEPWVQGAGCPADADLTDAIRIQDPNGDGVDEIAVLHRTTGDTTFKVDVHDRTVNRQVIEFGTQSGSTAIDIETITLGSDPAVATLGSRHADDSSIVKVQLVESGASGGGFITGGGFMPADLEVGIDAAGNEFLAIAEYRLHPLVTRVRIATPEGDLVGTINFGPFAPVDLEVVPDQDGDGEPEFALLATRPGVDAPIVKVRSGAAGNLLTSIQLKRGITPAALTQLDSFSGGPGVELAVLGEDTARGRAIVLITDGERKNVLNVIPLPLGWRSVDVAPMNDYRGSPAPEVALAIRAEGRDLVAIRAYDSSSGARILNIKTRDIHRPVSLFVADHKNGNEKETLLLARLRDAGPRIVVIERNPLNGKRLGSYVLR